MIESSFFIKKLQDNGFNFITGFYCSILESLFNECLQSKTIKFIPAQNEGEALSIAIGASLANSLSVVMSQNSALGDMLIPLNYSYRIKVGIFFILSLRTNPSEQHQLLDDVTKSYLKIFQMESDIITSKTSEKEIDIFLKKAKKTIKKGSFYVLLVKPDSFIKISNNKNCNLLNNLTTQSLENNSLKVFRSCILKWIITQKETILLAPEGDSSRELFSIKDRPQNLYHLPIGYVISFGLGLALSLPNKIITILDGDGSVSMRLNNLYSVIKNAPLRLIHIIFQNDVYASTGGQPFSNTTFDDMHPILKEMKYSTFRICFDLLSFQKSYLEATKFLGPHLIIIKVNWQKNSTFRKLDKKLSFYATRFKKCLIDKK